MSLFPQSTTRAGKIGPAGMFPAKKRGVTHGTACHRKPPGFLWFVLLGITGFCAGFFGPIIYVPEANQGPLVGILITGPGGVVLGLLLWLLMKLVPMSGRSQWILLKVIAVTGTLTTFYFVQPQPVTRGYGLEFTLERISPPGGAADDVMADWQKRIARATLESPRAGWEAQMRAALAADPGRVLETVLLRQRTIKEHRKPWNRGRLFATPWEPVQEKSAITSRPVRPSPSSLLRLCGCFSVTIPPRASAPRRSGRRSNRPTSSATRASRPCRPNTPTCPDEAGPGAGRFDISVPLGPGRRVLTLCRARNSVRGRLFAKHLNITRVSGRLTR